MAHDLKMLTRRWFDEVWNKGNTDFIDELLEQDVSATGLSQGPMKTVSHFKVFYKMYRDSFSNIQTTVNDCIQEGDKTACHVTFRMKHTGNALGFPATGKDVTVEAVILVYWRNGKIYESHNQFDQLGLLRQLGQETRSVTVD